MGRRLIKRKEREDGIEFRIFEHTNEREEKGYQMLMYSIADDHTSQYGNFDTEEQALEELDTIFKEDE